MRLRASGPRSVTDVTTARRLLMRKRVPALAVLGLSVATVVGGAVSSTAGPEKIQFPKDFRSGVLYTIADRHDVKQYRELYGTPEAVEAMKAGKPLPSGSVLTLVMHKAQVDAQGTPLKDANGRFLKGDLIGYTVMEKRTGWGTEYPPELRNGEWEYSVFTADQKFNDKANFKACFQCHKPFEKQDFVISQAKIGPKGASMAAVPGAASIGISGFKFGPDRVTVEAGKPVAWTNADDSPHQVTFTKSGERSPVLVTGQSHVQSFGAPGVYDYTCGLHPSMKGSVEVK
jgi:plastocyanin